MWYSSIKSKSQVEQEYLNIHNFIFDAQCEYNEYYNKSFCILTDAYSIGSNCYTYEMHCICHWQHEGLEI